MNFVDKPKVFHLAHSVVTNEIQDYLNFLGASEWKTNAQSDAELLLEIAGRRCYKSFGVGLNPNINRVREGNMEYLANVIKSKHGSVLEHVHDTFAMEDVSRVFTHEIVRHRLCNFSQESMRFVRPTALSTLFPSVYTEHLTDTKARQVRDIFESVFSTVEEAQAALVEICGLDDPDLPFHIKKLFQSANRRAIPDGVLTGIVVTTNARNWRHTIETRTALAAEEEIRFVYARIADKLQAMYPAIYQDMFNPDSDEDGVNPIGETVYGEFIPVYMFRNSKI